MNLNSTDLFGPAPRKARVEIIPLIDVIFFLLATFVLFTLSLNKIWSLEIQFPSTSGEPSNADMLHLQATERGAYYWKLGDAAPELITAAELGPRLTDYKAKATHPRVFVRGDDKATFGDAIFALDAVRLHKIEVSMETRPSPTGR